MVKIAAPYQIQDIFTDMPTFELVKGWTNAQPASLKMYSLQMLNYKTFWKKGYSKNIKFQIHSFGLSEELFYFQGR